MIREDQTTHPPPSPRASRPTLVTGIAGFIGFHVARQLLDQGARVVGLDNFNDYYAPSLKRARIDQLAGRSSLELLELDICDTSAVREVFERVRPARVCHLAAQAGVRHSLTHPFAYVQANLLGFQSVLEAARAAQVDRFVYATSSSIYGGNTKQPFSEGDRVDQPISLYAATKRANELVAHAYSHLHGMRTLGLRLFSVYGEWGRPDMAVWIFTRAIQQGRRIRLFGGGRMRRDMTHVSDIVQGILAALDAEGLGTCELFNLASGSQVDLTDLVRHIETRLGKSANAELTEMQPGDVRETQADIGRARQLLGYDPKVRVKEGVDRFVTWVEQHEELVARIDAIKAW